LAGTPLYMAPELALGHPPSEIADWYAFGVMLYQALAGRKPFTGDDVEMLRQKLAEPPPSPSTLRPDCDVALANLAVRLLDRDPVKRPRGDEVLRELGVPETEVAAVTRRHAPTPPVDRAEEREKLEEALASVEDAPVVVTVRGGPGTGKTTLVRRFLKGIRKRAQLYYGRCLELESVPFKGLDSAIDMLSTDLRYRQREIGELIPDDVSALVHLFPVLSRVPAFEQPRVDTRHPKGLRSAGIDAFGDLLGLLSVTAPVVMFLDDLQWVNDETVHLLLELLETNPPPILLVLAFRDADPPPALARLLAGLSDRARHLTLPPLDGAALDELATRLGLEVASLDPDARRLLEVIARAGGPLGKAEAMAGIANGAILVEQLRRRRFIQVQDDRLDVYHPRVREVVLG
ncbi:MAG: AAA family ATPase, partial [Kofleriaceae bacterium]|nr:AAA family ATPase [Kofleriaceae bacterium]